MLEKFNRNSGIVPLILFSLSSLPRIGDLMLVSDAQGLDSEINGTRVVPFSTPRGVILRHLQLQLGKGKKFVFSVSKELKGLLLWVAPKMYQIIR